MGYFSSQELAAIRNNASSSTATAPPPAPAPKRGGLGGFLRAAAAPAEYFLKADIINPGRQIAAQVTGNKKAYQNAVKAQDETLGATPGKAIKRLVGNSVGLATTVLAPEAKATTAARVIQGAKIGGAAGAGNALANDENIVTGALEGAAAGGGTAGILGKLGSKTTPTISKGGSKSKALIQSEQARGRVAGISTGSTIKGVELTPQDTSRMLKVIDREGLPTGNANTLQHALVEKRNVYGKQIAEHFKTNNAPLRPEDLDVIGDNFLKSLKTTNPTILEKAQHEVNDLKLNVKDLESFWKYRTRIDKTIPASKQATDEGLSATIAVKKAMRQYIAKELGNIPGAKEYHELSEIKPFIAAEAKRLNNTSGSIINRLAASGPIQKVEDTIGKIGQKIAGGGKPPVRPPKATTGVPPTILDRLTSNPQANNLAATAATAGAGRYAGDALSGDQQQPIQEPVAQAPTGAIGQQAVATTAEDILARQSAIGGGQDNNPYSPANIAASIAAIRQQGGTEKDVATFLSNAKSVNELTATAGNKPLNSTAAGVVADTTTGLQQLASLKEEIQSNSANNPLIGFVRGKNPLDTNAQSLQASMATAKQIVGKALEGGVLRAEDEKKYAKILPTLNDTDAVAVNKIDKLIAAITGRLNEYQAGISGGSGGTDLATLGL